MKLLLTSGGITNNSIANALMELAGKSFAEMKIAFVPTAAFVEVGDKGWLIDDLYRIKQLGAEVDIVDIAQLPFKEISDRLSDVDVLFVGGGNTFYLSYWMQQSGLMALLPELLRTKVYAGISAGSMIVGDSLRVAYQAFEKGIIGDDEYDELEPKDRSAAITARLVRLVVRPHLHSSFFPKITSQRIAEISKDLAVPVYAIDDQTAIKVDGDTITVVSEGEWCIYDKGDKL